MAECGKRDCSDESALRERLMLMTAKVSGFGFHQQNGKSEYNYGRLHGVYADEHAG